MLIFDCELAQNMKMEEHVTAIPRRPEQESASIFRTSEANSIGSWSNTSCAMVEVSQAVRLTEAIDDQRDSFFRCKTPTGQVQKPETLKNL